MKKAQSLDDFSNKPEKIIFPPKDMQDFMEILKKGGTGEFSRESFNKFLSKNKYARIAWSFTHKDGTVERFKSGRLMGASVFEGSKGTVIWKGYALPTDIPLFFWEDLYNQCCAYQGRKDYVEQKQLAGYAELEQGIGKEISYE